MKDNHVWNISKPPAPGWYHASATKNNSLFRWWDGKCWSEFATKVYDRERAAAMAAIPCNTLGHRIYWREIKEGKK